jgi:hypothetical protein
MAARNLAPIRPLLAIALLASVAATAPDVLAGAGSFSCGNVVAPDGITASDALAVLQTAVGLRDCSVCACDTDGNTKIAATDALFTLKKAVGQDVPLRCPACCEHCECTPQTLDLVIGDVTPCDGCIARTAASNTIDSIMVSIAGELDGTYELQPTAACVWEATLPGGFAEKVYYGSGNTTCSGSPSSSEEDSDVRLRVERTADGWQIRVGQYAGDLGWGDLVHGTIVNNSCTTNDKTVNENETCHLAAVADVEDRDTHATGGYAGVLMTDEEPVCP